MALVTRYAENIPVYWADTEDFIALARAYSTVLDRLFEDVASCFEAAINPATMARVELIELLDRLGYDDVRYYTTDELRALYVDIITTRRVMTEAAFAKHLQEACPSGIVVKLEVTDGTLNILPESPEQIVVYISVDRGGRTCASTECSSDCPCGGDGSCGGDTSCGLVYVVADASHLDYPRRDDDGNVLDWGFSYDSLARRIVDSFPASVRLMLDAILQPIQLGVVYAAVPSLVVDCYAGGKRGVKTKYIWGGMTDGETDMDIISSQAMSYTDLSATRASNYRPAIHVESTAGSETVEGFAEVGTARTSWSELRGEAILRTGQRGLLDGDGVVHFFTTWDLGDILSGADMTQFEVGQGFVEQYKEIGA